MTLFETAAEKGPFFKGLPSADDNAGYYAVVVTMWTLEKINERMTFFASAQCQWSETYSKDPQAKTELLRRANPVHSEEKKNLGKNLFTEASSDTSSSSAAISPGQEAGTT